MEITAAEVSIATAPLSFGEHYRMLSNFGEKEFDSGGRRLRRVLHDVLSTVARAARSALPQACTRCMADSGDALLCTACADTLPAVVDACGQCALPSSGGSICNRCRLHPPPYAAATAAWIYAFPADRLMRAFKYGGRLELAEPLALALCGAARTRVVPLPDRLLALPLSGQRQRMRGFNPAHEIARRVAPRIGVPLAAGLRRVRNGPPQAALGLAERARNMRGAFEAVQRFDGLTLAVIDDVMTTGATLAAAAEALRAGGALRVEAWVVARTLPPAWRSR
jgi:ComF family protein